MKLSPRHFPATPAVTPSFAAAQSSRGRVLEFAVPAVRDYEIAALTRG